MIDPVDAQTVIQTRGSRSQGVGLIRRYRVGSANVVVDVSRDVTRQRRRAPHKPVTHATFVSEKMQMVNVDEGGCLVPTREQRVAQRRSG